MSDPVFTIPADTSALGDIEAALCAWVVAATGIPAARVIRAEQDGPRPAAPFAEVRVGDFVALGAADALSTEYDSGADAGAEIIQTVRGLRDFTVTVRVFTASAVGGSSARALLANAQSSLRLPSVRDALAAAGVTCHDQGIVQQLPSVLDTKWEGRATLTARFYTEVAVSETTGYIDQVEVTDEAPVNPIPPFTVDAS